MTKDKLEKDQQRYKNMEKMKTKLDILKKKIMCSGLKSINVVGGGETKPDEAHFEALYNEKVNLYENQGAGFCSYCPRPVEI